MVIKFTCPRGHRMKVPADRAGRSGKCPECGTLFRVPKPEPGSEPDPNDSQADGPVLQAEEWIEFYCPNEHYLQAPAKLAGTRGKCPHCEAKFTIPTLEDEEEVEDVEEAEEHEGQEPDSDFPGVADEAAEPPEIRDAEFSEVVEEVEEVEEAPDDGGDHGGFAPPPQQQQSPMFDFNFVDQQMQSTGDVVHPAEHQHPMAALFERIWEEADREALIELHLSDGELVAPQLYAHDMSRGQHGVFAVKNRDDTHLITVVAWDNITRVTVRGLRELPPHMFD